MAETETMSLLDVIRTLGMGAFNAQATEQLEDLIRTMNDYERAGAGKPKGKIVLTLGFKLDRGIMEIEGAIKMTAPAAIQAKTIAYPTADGRLAKHDMRQYGLALAAPHDGTPDVHNIRDAMG